jgi:hypothetical protein
MNPETKKALMDSIAHWERHANGTAADDEEVFYKDCALCGMFLFNDHGFADCHGCPVKTKTGLSSCAGTPWKAAFMVWKKSGRRRIHNETTFRQAAAKMVRFLKSLLPNP